MLKRIIILFVLFTISMAAQPLQGLKFCIDPGHGGHDPANDRFIPATGFWESEGNWAKANYLKPILEDLGAVVIITRSGNDDSDDLALSQRAAIANAYNVDYFNSIHSNGYNGLSNYTLVLFRGYDNQPVFPVSKVMGDKLQNRIYQLNRTTAKYLRGDWSFYPDWGTSGLGVLRPLAMPGTLTEGSFHDYVPESWRLKGEGRLKEEAYAIARAFTDYYQNGNSGKGSIAGILRDPNQTVSYYFINGTNDNKLPLNYTHAWLEDSSVVFSGDDQNNGYYRLDSLDPGQYKVYMTAENYKLDSATVTVTADNTTFVDKLLNPEPNPNPPTVVSTFPESGAQNVSLSGAASILFDISMNTASVMSALTITNNIAYTFSWTENDKKLTILPSQLLSPGETYTISVGTGAKTAFDVAIQEAFSFDFTTRNKLNLTSKYPVEGDTEVSKTVEIRLIFDAPISSSTLSGNIGLFDASGNAVSVVVKLQYFADGKILFEPRNPLEAEKEYYITLKEGIGDTEGLSLGENYEIHFTTGPEEFPGNILVTDFEDVESWWDPEASGSTQGTSPDATTFTVTTEKKYSGMKSGKLNYKFIAENGLCRVYNSAKPSIGQPSEDAFGMWVFGDNSGNALEYWFYKNQSENIIMPIDTLNWTGWKYLSVPKDALGATGEILFHSIVLRQTSNGAMESYLYFDDASYAGLTSVEDNNGITPVEFSLKQNYPNPFNPSTTITFELPEKTAVRLDIYNILGEKVAELLNAELQSGRHSLTWNASGVPSGVYVYRIQAGEFTSSKKMILLK